MVLFIALLGIVGIGQEACPSVPRELIDRVDTLIAASDLDSAQALATRERSAAPRCATALLADALVKGARLKAASGRALSLSRSYRSALDEVLAVDAGNLRAREEIIEFLMYAPGIAGGSKDRARSEILRLGEVDAVGASRLRVALERNAGNALSIVVALEALHAQVPDDEDVVFELAQHLALANRFAEAEAMLAALAATPKGAEPRVRYATLFVRGRVRQLAAQELPEARDYYEAAIAAQVWLIRPRVVAEATLRLRLGEVQLLLGDCAGARTALEGAWLADSSLKRVKDARKRATGCR